MPSNLMRIKGLGRSHLKEETHILPSAEGAARPLGFSRGAGEGGDM